MAKIGDDVIEWQTDQLVQWLEQEGLHDCIETFRANSINGRLLVNLSEHEIKSLHHVSHDSKKKLIKTIEKFKRRKKEKMERMFGGALQAQTIQTRKPPSFSLDDNAGSDDDGWDSEEWDTEGSQDASSESEGDYLEPEEDLSKGGSLGRESVSVPTGLVAQLRAGIASSLSKFPGGAEPTVSETSYEDDEDIYDEPPEEAEEEELYDEPSDNSGGAIVVRPSCNKPCKSDEKGGYLCTRGMEEQDMYETPLQEEDLSPEPPSRLPKTNRFVPTNVAQGNKFVPVFNDNDNETYDIPELNDQEDQDDQEDSYEIPGEQAAPPPRPPKLGQGNMKQSKPPAQQKVLPGKPLPNSKGASIPHPSGHHQGTPGRFQNCKTPSSSSSLTPQGTPFRSQAPPPIQSKLGGRPQEQRKPEFPPKKSLPTKAMLPGRQGSPVGESVAPATGPRPLTKSALLNKKDPPQKDEKPSWTATETSSPHSRGGASLPPPTHKKQPSLPTDRPPPPAPGVEPVPPNRRNLASKAEPAPVKEGAVPPRPPKKGQNSNNQQPVSPMKKQGLPLPSPPVLSNPSFQREQSSASSVESTSADEPIISIQHLPKAGKRSLPALPPREAKSPLDIMKEAPWFQGPVDRKAVEVNLRKLNKDGSFLVRNSTKSPNDYSMSLFYNQSVRHLRIPYKNDKYVLGDSGIQKFDSIVDLVNYYRQNEVDLKAGGKTKLTVACPIYKS